MSTTEPTMRDYYEPRRFATPVSSFQRGFEDCMYDRIYANPFPKWSEE